MKILSHKHVLYLVLGNVNSWRDKIAVVQVSSISTANIILQFTETDSDSRLIQFET